MNFLQISSDLSGSCLHLPADLLGGLAGPGGRGRRGPGAGLAGSSDWRAHSEALWSGSWHSVHQMLVLPWPESAPRIVYASNEGLSSPQAYPGLETICLRKVLSYSSHPRPPCFLARSMTRRAYVRRSRVWLSGHLTAMKDKKHAIHESGDETSLNLGVGAVVTHWVELLPCLCTSSIRWWRAMLSPSSSFISTKSPALIFSTRFAGMGGSAGERIRGDRVRVAALGVVSGPNSKDR